MAFPDHLLTLATLRLLTLTPLASTFTPSTSTAVTVGSSSSTAHIHHPQDRFHSVRARPLRILTELTAAYLQVLGNAAKNHAEQAGRTAANALDAREAIADYGGSIEEVDEWARDCQLDRGILSSHDAMLHDAADGERADAAELGALLKDTSYNPAYHPPAQVLEYAPLTDREAAIVDAVQHNDSLLAFLPYELQQRVQQGQDDTASSSSSSEDDEHEAASPASSSRGISQPPPPSYQEATFGPPSLRKREKSRARDYDDKEEDDPMSFLPPFPDLDATHASLQTIIEDESGRIVKRARRALDINLNTTASSARKNASIAWLRAVPYESSSLAEYEGGKFSVPSMNADTSKNGMDEAGLEGEDEEDAFVASSLPYFLETFNWVSLDYEQQGDQALLPLRHNAKRKRAATAIHSNILNPSDDSLSGSIPALPPRHAKKQAGWIPYPLINPDISDPSEPGGKAIRPFPFQLHPFGTQLPNSITEPVPQWVLPHSMKVLAPPMHPRYPTASTSIRTLLESSSPALFSRTTRIGPPGPLLENGAAGFYQVEAEKPIIPGWPGDAMPRMMGWNFDWEIGNELEDGIKERKAAGIQDMALHSSSSAGEASSSSATLAMNGNDRYSRDTTMNGATGAKDGYTGPNFPSLPMRSAHDISQQASMVQQREQERREEQAELQFQEVQEDKESEALLRARAKEEAEVRAQQDEQQRLRAAEVEAEQARSLQAIPNIQLGATSSAPKINAMGLTASVEEFWMPQDAPVQHEEVAQAAPVENGMTQQPSSTTGDIWAPQPAPMVQPGLPAPGPVKEIWAPQPAPIEQPTSLEAPVVDQQSSSMGSNSKQPAVAEAEPQDGAQIAHADHAIQAGHSGTDGSWAPQAAPMDYAEAQLADPAGVLWAPQAAPIQPPVGDTHGEAMEGTGPQVSPNKENVLSKLVAPAEEAAMHEYAIVDETMQTEAVARVEE